MVGRRTVIAAIGCGVLSGWLGLSRAEVDPAAVLPGKWEGRLEGGPPGDPGRTLTVETVREREGKWTASGAYGVTGRRLVRVEIAITRRESDLILEFSAPSAVGPSHARLVFPGGNVMRGTLVTPGAAGARQQMDLRLERVGQK